MNEDGFWLRGATAFFDVRVTHVNSKCKQGQPTQIISKQHENEKERKYQQRVLDVEMGHLLPFFSGQMMEWEVIVSCFSNNLQEK